MPKQPFENVVQYLFQIAAKAEFKALNDQELLKRYVDHRDELAFGELVSRYKMMIWYTCWRVLRHHHDVEDAFQATIMTLVRKAKVIVNRETIEGWIHRTAFTVASNAKVARMRRRAREERSATMRKDNYQSHEARWELSEVLDQELLRIPEKYRSPLLLCYLEGLTQLEAAQRLGTSIEALDQRLRRGREQLKQRLSKYGMEWGPITPMTLLASGVQVPAVPPELVNRTLDMARIMMLSNGALETVGIPVEVATLAKGVLGMTLKMKLLLGSLVVSLVAVAAGTTKYSGALDLLLGIRTPAGKPEVAYKAPAEPKTIATPPRMDSYGDPLPTHALARMGTVRLWQGLWEGVWTGNVSSSFNSFFSPFTSLIASPDGKMLASHRAGSSVYLWDLTTGKIIRQLATNANDRNERLIQSLAFSPDSRRLVAVYRDQVRLWEVATGHLLHVYHAPKKNGVILHGVAFLPNGKILVAQKYFLRLAPAVPGKRPFPMRRQMDGIQIWEATTGKVIPMDGEVDGNRIRVAFSLDGKTLAATSERGKTVQLWEVTTGKEIRQLIVHKADNDGFSVGHRSIIFSPDGKTLAFVDPKEQQIGVWDIATGKKISQLDGGTGMMGMGLPSFPLAYSPDGTTLAGGIGKLGKPGHLWSVATGKEIHSFDWIDVKVVTFSPDGKILATGDSAGVIRWWEVATGKEIGPRTGCRAGIQSIAYSADGKTLLSVSQGQDQTIRWWEVATGKETRQQTHPQGYNRCLAYSLDGKTLATTYDNRLSLVEESTGKVMRQFKQLDPHFAVFSPDSKILAASDADKIVHVWEIATGKEIYRLPTGCLGLNSQFWMAAFSPDGRMLAGPGKDGTVCLWDMATGQVIGHLGKPQVPGPKGRVPKVWESDTCIRSLAFSPDGKMLVGAVGDTARLWEVATGKEIYSLNKPGKIPQKKEERLRHWGESFAFSPDGRMLAAAGGEDKMIYLWEVATGKEICQLSGHRGRVNTVAFAPDGKALASCSDDVTCLIWDITPWSRLKTTPAGVLSQQALSQKQLETAWNDLAHRDAAKAYDALRTLRAVPQQIIPWLQAQIQPVAPLSNLQQQQLRQWIADLDHNRFEVRAQAQQEVEKQGDLAISALRQALASNPSLEARRRLQHLLAQLEPVRLIDSPRRLREIRAVQILESMGTPEAQQVLQTWAQGVAEASLTQDAQAALTRLRKRSAAKP